jgi:drug/metabolite transporter (DMT)-like permease
VPAARRDHPLLGIALIAAATVLFASMDNSARWLGRRLPVLSFFWARYAFQAAAMGLWLAAAHGRAGFKSASVRFQLLRGLLLAAVSALVFYGLQHMPAPEFTAINMLAPLLVTVLAAAWLKEPVTRLQRALVAGGFLGALLVVRPGSGLYGWAALFPVASALCFASFQLLTRHLAGTERVATTHFFTGAVGTAVLTPFLLADLGAVLPAVRAAPPGVLAVVLLLGALGTAGHLLLILALGLAPASVLMPFSYLQIGFATALGALIFDQWPDGWSFAGMGVIAACGAAGAWLNVRGRRPPPGPSTPASCALPTQPSDRAATPHT